MPEKVELIEQRQTTGDRVQVLVTFLDASTIDPAKLRQLIDQLETIAGVQQGFEELNAGQTRSIAQFSQEMHANSGTERGDRPLNCLVEGYRSNH